MNRTVLAQIIWIPEEQGGRKEPPQGSIYYALARFDDIKDQWPLVAWTLVVKSPIPPTKSLSVVTEVGLLMPNAPAELLRPGSSFELFEGNKLVATGEVLP